MNGLILQLTLILIDLGFKPLKEERMQMESIHEIASWQSIFPDTSNCTDAVLIMIDMQISQTVYHTNHQKGRHGLPDRSGLRSIVLSVGRFCIFMVLFIP